MTEKKDFQLTEVTLGYLKTVQVQIFLQQALFQYAFVERNLVLCKYRSCFQRYLHEMCIQPSNQSTVSEVVIEADRLRCMGNSCHAHSLYEV